MEGVTVLATNMVQNSGIGAGVICFFGVLFMACCAAYAISEDVLFVGFLAIAFAVLLMVFGVSFITDKSVTVKYDVTISDSVSFNEFDKKYDILSQNGKIYTVVEKDEE